MDKPESRRAQLLLALASFAMWAAACASSPSTSHHDFDLKITNARIVDGTGAPWFHGDIGVRGDTIVSVGDLEAASARETIDAQNYVVAPGFIDLLGQSESSVLIDPNLEGKIRQGVTTEVTGEGSSPGPVTDKAFAQRAESDPDKPNWRTLGDFMRVIEQRGTALNFAFFVGATNPRSIVLGSIDRDPTPEEMSRMEAIVDQAMREGAIGLSSSLIYVPATFRSEERRVGKECR